MAGAREREVGRAGGRTHSSPSSSPSSSSSSSSSPSTGSAAFSSCTVGIRCCSCCAVASVGSSHSARLAAASAGSSHPFGASLLCFSIPPGALRLRGGGGGGEGAADGSPQSKELKRLPLALPFPALPRLFPAGEVDVEEEVEAKGTGWQTPSVLRREDAREESGVNDSREDWLDLLEEGGDEGEEELASSSSSSSSSGCCCGCWRGASKPRTQSALKDWPRASCGSLPVPLLKSSSSEQPRASRVSPGGRCEYDERGA